MTVQTTDPAPSATQTTAQTLTLTLSNTCTCMTCPECNVLFDESEKGPDACPECGDTEQVTFGDCGGDCYRNAIEVLADMVSQWREANPSVDNEWVITGHGMGWRRRTGTKHIDLTTECLSDAISVNSEWTQRFTVEAGPGGTLTCVQSHHDAPTGEVYTVEPLR